MAEVMASQLGEDTMICIFPGGQGATAIAALDKGSKSYERFLDDLRHAFNYVKNEGGQFLVPAICWMQGESDIVDYPETNYKKLLQQFSRDINSDIKSITHQKSDVRIICYQTNAVTRAMNFNENNYNCKETAVCQSFVELLREDSLFWLSGPIYPYDFVREAVHIDAISQKRLGALEGKAAMSILRKEPRFMGLLPLSLESEDSVIRVKMNVPCPPLKLDTSLVAAIDNYGFKVLMENGRNILSNVTIDGDDILLHCIQQPTNCRVRYAVNGELTKSGNQRGPRGNLRDSQGDYKKIVVLGISYPLHNWCLQFDELLASSSR